MKLNISGKLILILCLLGIITFPLHTYAIEKGMAMQNWIVEGYYAGDLFHFLWSIGEGQYCSRHYPEIKAEWRSNLDKDVVQDIDTLVDFKITAFSQSILGTIFRYSSNGCIQDIIFLIDRPEVLKAGMLKAGEHEGNTKSWVSHVEKNKELLKRVLIALEQAGYDKYYKHKIKPIVNARCEEMRKQLEKYSVENIKRSIEGFLGPQYVITGSPNAIYLTYFSYSLAYHLPDNSSVYSFSVTQPLRISTFISTFVHELLHNYYPSDELRTYLQRLSENQLYMKTRQILHGYWGEPDSEDLIVAAEKYLAVDMGVLKSEQVFEHLYRKYDRSLILAVIIYDNMSREGLAGKTYENFLINLFENGVIQPEIVDQQYIAILEKQVGADAAQQTLEKIEQNYKELKNRK